MVKTTGSTPERLRDITFPVWDHQPISKHGFLAFTTEQSFLNEEAYTGHAPGYLLAMYVFYKIEMCNKNFPMRAVIPTIAMVLCLYVIFRILAYGTKRIERAQGFLLILSLLAFLTLPVWWISAGKANVDNVYMLVLPLIIWSIYLISKEDIASSQLWVPFGALSFVSPMYGCLLGLYLMTWGALEEGRNTNLLKIGVITFGLNLLLYVAPYLVSKLLHFKSSSSSWGFRSGLDGDMSYFSNTFNAIAFPFKGRSVAYIIWPLSFLSAQLIRARVYNQKDFDKRSLSLGSFNEKKFFWGIFSAYLFTAILWPQAVSIHPYLYDILLIGPISIWILLNFGNHVVLSKEPFEWVVALLFLISFNLQQIAQAAHTSSSYIFPS
jgi:hypothetical protein